MRRDTIKLLAFAGIIAFAVLYGMELTSKGIQDVNGSFDARSRIEPLDEEEVWQTQSSAQSRREQSNKPASTKPPVQTDAPDQEPSYDWDEELMDIPRDDRRPIVDRVSGKTGEVLNDLSRSGIRAVVSLFDQLTGG